MKKLGDLLGARADGYWELLATAAGRRDAADRSVHGVSARALEDGFEGPAISPSVVRMRIDALAALDARRLVALSTEWKSPHCVGVDIMDDAADFWAAAWSASLRFLRHLDALPNIAIRAIPRQIRLEYDVLWPSLDTSLESHEQLIRFALEPGRTYDDFRKLDAIPLSTFESFTRDDVMSLVGGSMFPSDHELERLRVLITRHSLVAPDAFSWLLDVLRARWFALSEAPQCTGGLLVLLSLAIAAPGATNFVAELEEHFLTLLRRSGSPDRMAPFAYLFLRGGWQVP